MKRYWIIGVVVLVVLGGLWAINVRTAVAPTNNGLVSLDARIGQEGKSLEVSITPLVVVQDSRCPVGVQCIWAGTVKLTARLGSGLGTATQEFTLGEPITTEAEMVTLKEVFPAPQAGVTIPEGDYLFRFEVAKRTDNISPL